jgi:phosphate:Na+ symporter
MLSQALGGLGLFLIGMVLTTDGLRAAAGDTLRRVLLRFTGGPVKALLTGAAITAIVQSSSATTMAVIGFVGAGMLTFHQSLGVIFGANLGTTVTSWIVAAVGLKFSMSVVALPLVGIGALMRLFMRGRAQHVGMALAGFGMIFVGIDFLQAGLSGLSSRLTPAVLPDDTFLGRLLLIGIGAVLTAILQSSSAAMAATLTALHTGGIDMSQAAAMAIGVNIGTTVTAGLASLGASLAARRTALAHLLFNSLTGVIAFAGLPLFLALVRRVGDGDPAIQLAAFHTTFNLVGVLLLLPASRWFAAAVERALPERGPRLTRHLDPTVAGMGSIAVEAVRRTVLEIAAVSVLALRDILRSGGPLRSADERLDAAAAAIAETRTFLGSLRVMEGLSEDEHERHLSTVHALDYVGRLVDNARAAGRHAFTASPALREVLAHLESAFSSVLAWSADAALSPPVSELRSTHTTVADIRRRQRAQTLRDVAAGRVGAVEAERQLDAMRWLDEDTFYIFRLAEHLAGERVQDPPPPAPGSPTAGASGSD